MSGTDYVLTPNLGLYKPLPNADINAWGGHLNSNADTLDTALHSVQTAGPFLPLAGGTVTGATTFTASPALHISGAAGSFRTLRFETAGVARFSLALDSSTETGTNNAGSNLVMSSFSDTGASLNVSFLAINRNTGRLTLSAPLQHNANMGAAFGPGNTNGIWQQCSFTGSTSFGPLQSFNQWAVNSDTMAYTGQGLFQQGIFYNFGGAGYTGNRGGQLILMTQTGPASGLSGSGGIVASQMGCIINNTCGGSAGAYAGGMFGLNIYNRLTSGASFFVGSVGMEIDIESAAGSSYLYQTGIQVVPTTAHQQVAGIYTQGFVVAGQTGTIGLDYGFLVNSWGLQSGSALLMADWAADNPTWTMRRGLDLRAPTFTSDIIAASAFAVGPTGRVRVGTGFLDYNGAGAILDAGGAVVTTGTLTSSVTTAYAADGNHYYAEDPYGGVWQMTFLSGSTSITAITLQSAGYVQGAPPANPITLTPRGGLKRFVPGTITANLTWDSTRTLLSLNPTGKQVLTNLPAAATDAAAATAGVPIGGLYNNAGVVHVRLT